jgi:hypothetical protein
MVDLARTEEQFLAEIHFTNGSEVRETPALDVPWRVVGCTPADLFPLLTKTFSACYPHIATDHLTRDLIDLVKKGLGNAYKWGNSRDRDKLLMVTTVMTRLGAVIKISDQGNGFDVARVVRDRSFTHGGSGLTRFRKTSSVISYADGGRTLLIRFLCDVEPVAATGDATEASTPANTCPIELSDLRLWDQVKVKGVLEPDGTFLARRLTVKAYEELSVIEAPLQSVQGDGRVIRILGLSLALPQNTDIIDAELKPAAFDQLRAGQVVWLSGRCVPGEGLAPVRIKIRRGQNGHASELQGRIEAIEQAGRSFRIAGVTIVTNDHTEILSRVHLQT